MKVQVTQTVAKRIPFITKRIEQGLTFTEIVDAAQKEYKVNAATLIRTLMQAKKKNDPIEVVIFKPGMQNSMEARAARAGKTEKPNSLRAAFKPGTKRMVHKDLSFGALTAVAQLTKHLKGTGLLVTVGDHNRVQIGPDELLGG